MRQKTCSLTQCAASFDQRQDLGRSKTGGRSQLLRQVNLHQNWYCSFTRVEATGMVHYNIGKRKRIMNSAVQKSLIQTPRVNAYSSPNAKWYLYYTRSMPDVLMCPILKVHQTVISSLIPILKPQLNARSLKPPPQRPP